MHRRANERAISRLLDSVPDYPRCSLWKNGNHDSIGATIDHSLTVFYREQQPAGMPFMKTNKIVDVFPLGRHEKAVLVQERRRTLLARFVEFNSTSFSFFIEALNTKAKDGKRKAL